MPSVAIVIPCYNAAATLARTLDSCLFQPEAHQILVVDDGSTDDSPDIARRFEARDSRVHLLRMPVNGGAAKARNWGALHASKPLLAFMDADDEFLPDALTAACDFLANNPGEAAVRLDVDFFGFPYEITAHPQFNDAAMVLSKTVPSSLIVHKQAYFALGGFPMDDCFRQHGGEDGALSLALTNTFGNTCLNDRKRVRMHYHHGIHAERYFLARMGKPLPSPVDAETTKRTYDFANEARKDMGQLRQWLKSR